MKKISFVVTLVFLLIFNVVFVSAEEITTNDYKYAWIVQYSDCVMIHQYNVDNPDMPTHHFNNIVSKSSSLNVPVVAPYDGVVRNYSNACTHMNSQNCGCNNGCGNLVILQLSDGNCVFISHLSRGIVKTGETVKRGDVIGYVGRTGIGLISQYPQVGIEMFTVDENGSIVEQFDSYYYFGDYYRCLEHSFTNFTDNGDGTESAKCDNCYIVATRTIKESQTTNSEKSEPKTSDKEVVSLNTEEVVPTKANEGTKNNSTGSDVETVSETTTLEETTTSEVTTGDADLKKPESNEQNSNDAYSVEKTLSSVIASSFVALGLIKVLITRLIPKTYN